MSDNKPPKPNGTGIDPMQRLTSLKPSRDLTLGAAKPTKKVFLPNLNVARNKNKGPSTSNQAAKKDDRNRRDRSNDKNKNFRGPNVIKSTGVFSEGLGQAERHSSRASFGREADAKPSMQKPTIRVRDFVKIDKELEDQKIRSVLGEGSDLNGGSGYVDGPSVDFKKTSEKDAPIKLPMDDGCWTEPIPPVKVKQEVIVKTEPDELEHFVGDKKPVAAIKQEHCEETEVVKLLKKSEPTLILLQLPDTLPGRGGARETDAPRRKGQEEPSTSAAQDTPVDNRCYLSELEEGRIGTIRTHRSGRVTLLLGDTVFEVNMGTKPAFHQEVVSMACDEASRSAALVSLGALQHKLSIVPHWETMFKEINK